MCTIKGIMTKAVSGMAATVATTTIGKKVNMAGKAAIGAVTFTLADLGLERLSLEIERKLVNKQLNETIEDDFDDDFYKEFEEDVITTETTEEHASEVMTEVKTEEKPTETKPEDMAAEQTSEVTTAELADVKTERKLSPLEEDKERARKEFQGKKVTNKK